MGRMPNRTALSLSIVAALAACGGSDDAPLPADEDQLAWKEACVRLSGCEPYASLDDPVSTCSFHMLDYPGSSQARCATDAASCEEAAACFGAGSTPEPCESDRAGRCEGDVLHRCDLARELELARDCTVDGLRCLVNDFGDASCAFPESCTEGRCEGDTPLHCYGGVLVPQEPCPPGRCVPQEGFPTCGGEGEVCEEPLFRCDGDVAVSCMNGFLHREQCRPGACRTDDGARCLPTEECFARCEGATRIDCVGGTVVEHDCTEWGFEECVDDERGVRCR